MRSTLRAHAVATEGNESATSFHATRPVESAGNSLSLRCLNEAIDGSGVPRKILAEECRQTEPQFSKSLSGTPGGNFNGVVDRIRPAIRADYGMRLAAVGRDAVELAAEELAHAAIRYLRTTKISLHMASASLKGEPK